MSLTAPLAYKLMHYFPNTNVPPGPRTSIFTNAQDAVTLECVSFNESGNVSGGFGLGHKRRICWMGALFGAFSLGSLPCVYKGAKNDINSFMHRHFDIFVSIHTHFAVFSPPTKYVTNLRFFRTRVKTLRYFSLPFFSVLPENKSKPMQRQIQTASKPAYSVFKTFSTLI